MSIGNTIKQNCPELEFGGFNIAELSEMMDTRYLGDFSIFIAASEIFLEGYVAQLADIKKAITDMDTEKIHATAHKFKGGISNFHDLNVTETVRLIEMNSAKWTKEELLAQYSLLGLQMGTFISQLKQLTESFAKIQQEAA